MLLLHETTAGVAIFKTTSDDKIENQLKSLQLLSFKKYKNLKRSLKANTEISKGKAPKALVKAVRSSIKKERESKVGMCDLKLATSLKRKLGEKFECVSSNCVNELLREIRTNFDKYVSSEIGKEIDNFKLGLSHVMSTKKLKFSTDKVDLMIVQAISLLDDIDKEQNTYLMRIKEWYGWHFPELVRIVADHKKYVRVVMKISSRKQTAVDLSDILDQKTEEEVNKAAQTSMGTDIGPDDEASILFLCTQFNEMTEYRESLNDYLLARMNTVAPCLSRIVGELIGARLISKAGSLMNLAKSPASTVQIFGAEKALFRALKNKSNPPKYGLIFNAKTIGKQPNKTKGAAARILANNASLACRFDAFSTDKGDPEYFAERLTQRVEKALKLKNKE